MGATAKQVGQTARDLAKQVARQMAQEPLEILKEASGQVTGQEFPPSPDAPRPPQTVEEQQKLMAHQEELRDKMQAGRRMEAFQRELDEIRKQNLFKDLQAKIAEGQDVPIEDYGELSMEQKQVLKAQMEAVTFQKKQAEYNEAQGGGALFGSAKKGRKMGGGQKHEAEKQQTRVEKPVPPSG